MARFASLIAALCLVVAFSAPARAEFELSFYTGFQSAPHSDVSGNDPGGAGDFDFTAAWDGRPFEAPPYYGFRGTWWRNGGDIGYALDFNHAKVYADDESLAEGGFSRLEFTDGLNLITLNVFKRWSSETRRITPYVGAGLGVAVPHVDVASAGGKTFGYQYTGPAVQWVAGLTYPLTDRWSIFGEYKGTYSQNSADLDNGGKLETNIVTNAVNLGVSFNF